MEIRTCTAADEEVIKALWSYCFEGETDPWFQWYFKKLYTPERVLAGEEGGKIACNLHRRPYRLFVRGAEVPTDYIVGVATHPAARGRGYGTKLLQGAFRMAKEENKGVVILMPSAASYYYPQGFSFYAHQWKRSGAPENLVRPGMKPLPAGLVSAGKEWKILDTVYKKYVKGRNGWTIRDEESWKNHMEAQFCDGGFIAAVEDKNGPAGYIFYHLAERKMQVSEMAFSSEEGRLGLYAYMAGHRGSIDECEWYEPLDDRDFLYWNDGAEHTFIENKTFPYMMGRITDPVTAFEGLSCPSDLNGVISFELADEFLPENSGIYSLIAENGKIHAVKYGESKLTDKAEGNKNPPPSFTTDSGTLAQLFFGTLSLRESESSGKIMWTDGADRESVLKTADAMLPKQNNWINEWY